MNARCSVRVAESPLRRWIQQLGEERQGLMRRNPAMTTDQRRIQELEARIERLEREKTILKKAIALLMSEGVERTR